MRHSFFSRRLARHNARRTVESGQAPTRGPRFSAFFRPSAFGFRTLAVVPLALGFFLSAAASRAGVATAPAPEIDIRRDAVVAAIDKVLPSVVNIATETITDYHDWYDDLLRQFYGLPGRQQKSISLGSGVIIDEDGYVLTNYHVVRRANRIQVKLWDGREYEADALMATMNSDVALLKLRGKPGEKFKAIKFAADDDLLLGETVMALGNPFGLGGSVTKGILSSKNRRPTTGSEPLNVEDWLQTDAAINPGNSGGPLINLRGELIGLNVAVQRDQTSGERGMGVGFSIPIKQVSLALSHFFTPEMTDSLWFGAQFRPDAGSLLVSAVEPESPAAQAGLSVGDHVLEVNGCKVSNLIACNRLLGQPANHQVAFTLNRDTGRRSVTVRLIPFAEVVRKKLGLKLLEITPQNAPELGMRAGTGLYLEEVEKGSPAEKAQLQPGFVLSAIDGQSSAELRTAVEVLTSKKKGDPVHLTILAPLRVGANYVQIRQGMIEVKVR